MHSRYDEIESFLRNELAAMTGREAGSITGDTVLVGHGRVVDSADLVMLLLAAEDYARDTLNAHFDWTSDTKGSISSFVTDRRKARRAKLSRIL